MLRIVFWYEIKDMYIKMVRRGYAPASPHSHALARLSEKYKLPSMSCIRILQSFEASGIKVGTMPVL